MADKKKEAELLDWVDNVNWQKHIYDHEVQVILTQLRERIEKISSSESSGGDGDGKSGTHRVKIVAVGDGAVGKTSMLIAFSKGTFPTEYVPTVFENYTKQMKRDKDNSNILLHLWDTAGQEDFDRLRPLSYPGADLIILAFSTVMASSLESVKQKWAPEVNHFVPDSPYFLVGTKVDLRDEKKKDNGEFSPVTTEEGEAMAAKLKAAKYIEISSKTRHNLDKLFQDAVDCVLDSRKPANDAHDQEADNTSGARTTTKKRSGCTLL